uniref:Uncharacterized protein n=1 Tax=Rhizophagus irregularis (strain DAOM 181602 / DAOM 197198 / MUCL 43194) TaxID=747089 RepID=U9UDH6_RHIID
MKTDIIPSLTNHSNTLIKLKLEYYQNGPLSFITNFINLQELVLTFRNRDYFHELSDKLQNVILPQLQILKFLCAYPESDVIIKFLENNGKNLKEFYISCENSDDSINLAIAKFCQNLQLLSILFESIGTRHDNDLLKEKDLLESLAKYSPKNFYRGCKNSLEAKEGNMEVIEKYKKLVYYSTQKLYRIHCTMCILQIER